MVLRSSGSCFRFECVRVVEAAGSGHVKESSFKKVCSVLDVGLV